MIEPTPLLLGVVICAVFTFLVLAVFGARKEPGPAQRFLWQAAAFATGCGAIWVGVVWALGRAFFEFD